MPLPPLGNWEPVSVFVSDPVGLFLGQGLVPCWGTCPEADGLENGTMCSAYILCVVGVVPLLSGSGLCEPHPLTMDGRRHGEHGQHITHCFGGLQHFRRDKTSV